MTIIVDRNLPNDKIEPDVTHEQIKTSVEKILSLNKEIPYLPIRIEDGNLIIVRACSFCYDRVVEDLYFFHIKNNFAKKIHIVRIQDKLDNFLIAITYLAKISNTNVILPEGGLQLDKLRKTTTTID
jgi:hypothetical protein